MTDFFPTDSENAAFDAWKHEVETLCCHGVPPTEAYMLKAFTEGLTADRVAADADWDYEETAFDEPEVVDASGDPAFYDWLHSQYFDAR